VCLAYPPSPTLHGRSGIRRHHLPAAPPYIF
jgi:hypothetical protein